LSISFTFAVSRFTITGRLPIHPHQGEPPLKGDPPLPIADCRPFHALNNSISGFWFEEKQNSKGCVPFAVSFL
jgi:hypothetical protein